MWYLTNDDDDDYICCVSQLSQLPVSPEAEEFIAKDSEVNLLRTVSHPLCFTPRKY